MKSLIAIGSIAALVYFAPAAVAKSPAEIEQIAKSVSVEIIGGVGSGVVLHRQSNLYTVVTNRHVVCQEQGLCSESNLRASDRLKTADGRVHQFSKSDIKLLKDSAGNVLDLAIIQFKSDRNYQVAQVADPNSLKVGNDVYTAGFPEGQGWLFGTGKAQAVVNKRLIGDNGGYTVIYDAATLPGMSGGGAFDGNGRLVAVHGQGDKYKENTQATVLASNAVKIEVGSKIGYNRGISVRWVIPELGVLIGNRQPLNQIRAVNPNVAATADELFIAGFNKFVDPGTDVQAGKKEAVDYFNQALILNPRYTIAYFYRAYVRYQLGANNFDDLRSAMADFDQAITLNPKFASAYISRGNLKHDKFYDPQGAIADFDQAITINPKFASAYISRGYVKRFFLKDAQGALADFNQGISVDPKFAYAYYTRGSLKQHELNDPQGALLDYDQAISVNPNYGDAYYARGFLKDDRLNDLQGALADYNRAISLLNSKFHVIYVYGSRAELKLRLNDLSGANEDFRNAARIRQSYEGRAVNLLISP
jgi:tetratricopeptide (TPR) repeat protein